MEYLLRKTNSSQLNLILSQFKELRTRLFKILESLTIEQLDYSPDQNKVETIGTLALHIAAVEWSWIFEDIFGKEMEYEKWKLAFPLREGLQQLQGKSLLYYLKVLEDVRNDMLVAMNQLSDDNLQDMFGEKDTYSLEWILFHILEHEAIHIGQIQILLRLQKLDVPEI